MPNAWNIDSPYCLSLADVEEAQVYLKGLIHQTPIMTSSSLDESAQRHLYFKCEIFQKTGSFKVRGALNAVRFLSAGPGGKPQPVVTHSCGNHGQALSLAARMKGIPAYIVVPRTVASCKKAAIQGYGAYVVECEPTYEDRTEMAAKIVQETGGHLVHTSWDEAVIAGQGTIGLEVLQQVPDLDAIVVVVGGGGMLAGVAVVVKALRPDVKVYAAEPHNANDCFQSKLKGRLTPNPGSPDTIAEGVKGNVGVKTWPIIRDLVDDVFTVSEEEIKQATRLVWERMKLVIEPTAGVGVAAVLSQRFKDLPQEMRNICVVLCGGNVDLGSLDWLRDTQGPPNA
ncbi:serine racemase-like [Ambystoma mexicanum]|uniref:serine racemase-like n=1 Tax=Ambystoma mexicanum TaxID=8296 RepID=UPI0037E7ECF2